MDKKQGKIFILEGGEGTGKTTIAKYIEKNISNMVYLREPGGNELCEKIRDIIVHNDIPKYAEALLFIASRDILINSTIKPLLAEGKNIILDRFHISTLVYQCFVKGCDTDLINEIHDKILADLPIETVYILDTDTRIAKRRIVSGDHDNNKFEDYDETFHLKIRTGYIRYSMGHPDNVAVLNTDEETIENLESMIMGDILNTLSEVDK